MATTNEKGRFSKVYLTIHVPKGRAGAMRKLLKPVLNSVDPDLHLVQVQDAESPLCRIGSRVSEDVPGYCVSPGELSVPAVSVMTFPTDDDDLERTRGQLQKFPWKLHHSVELSTSSSPNFVSAKQQFYALSRQYPLVAVCPSSRRGCCSLRFNLSVRNFGPMLEFYRLLTDSEMESSKPDFAVFSVNTAYLPFTRATDFVTSSSSSCRRKVSSRLSCHVQLALKHSPTLNPYPLTSTYLTVFVRNMAALRRVLLPGQIIETSPNSYLISDPDGNLLAVHDLEPPCPPPTDSLHPGSRVYAQCQLTQQRHAQTCPSGEASSTCRSYCESQDSGRFSDSEKGSRQLDLQVKALLKDFGCLDITDYSESSETDTDDLGLDDSGANSDSDTCRGRVRIGHLSAIHVDKHTCEYV
ncbi:hypothetical protein C0Q70_04577 [Pomacea canaliculata]|uniref:FAM124 domain-containing protein n=1 Tax=Pomacea canaliculata TaxID=400727 RepID=A0A2T7PIR9_POMCA|nr:protein FAM124A-like [Pomacea canaliculata]PVD33323.1 hypothetical protein C0Q70_04577 [Pomacea canaliculata]